MATAAYKALAEGNAVTLAFCWAHARRNFFDIQAANPAPIAVEALARIGALYAIERDIRGLELRRGWPPAKPEPDRSSRR